MNRIKIRHQNLVYDANWVEEYSNMSKDIAVLSVEGSCPAKPLVQGDKIYPNLKVYGYGFLEKTIQNTPKGVNFSGRLSPGVIPIEFKEKATKGRNIWNSKPKVNVMGYKIIECDNLGSGLSGSPVCAAGEEVLDDVIMYVCMYVYMD
jgi:hypothetical protein